MESEVVASETSDELYHDLAYWEKCCFDMVYGQERRPITEEKLIEFAKGAGAGVWKELNDLRGGTLKAFDADYVEYAYHCLNIPTDDGAKPGAVRDMLRYHLVEQAVLLCAAKQGSGPVTADEIAKAMQNYSKFSPRPDHDFLLEHVFAQYVLWAPPHDPGGMTGPMTGVNPPYSYEIYSSNDAAGTAVHVVYTFQLNADKDPNSLKILAYKWGRQDFAPATPIDVPVNSNITVFEDLAMDTSLKIQLDGARNVVVTFRNINLTNGGQCSIRFSIGLAAGTVPPANAQSSATIIFTAPDGSNTSQTTNAYPGFLGSQ